MNQKSQQSETNTPRDLQPKKFLTLNKSFYVAGGIGMAILVILGIFVLIQSNSSKLPIIMSFDECARAGYPVMESYPRQCQIPDGKVFVEEIGGAGKGKDGCMITGCSSQICSDEEVITTCEVLPEHQCYQNAACERQQNGECGWTQTNGLNQCLQEHRQEDKEQFGDAATKEECLAKAGVWQRWGLAQRQYCQIPAKDAGKSCTDQSQCTYGCISETGTVPGKCATYKNTFGCFSLVDNGKAEQALCVD